MRPTASAARGIGASVRVSLYLGCPGRELAEGTPRHRIDLGHGQDSAEPRPIHNLDQLPGDPFRVGCRRGAQPQNPTAVMPQDKQAVQKPERNCWHHEQVHRGDAVGMVAQKGPPALLRWASPPGHVLGHARLPDIDAKLEKFAMNPRRSPHWIGKAHLADQLADLKRHL